MELKLGFEITFPLYMEDGSTLRNLRPKKYRVYGVIDSWMSLCTKVLTPPRSFTCTISTPPIVPVKVESGLDLVINLLNFFDDDRCIMPEVNPSPLAPFSSLVSLPSNLQIPSFAIPESFVKQPCSIVDLLRRLANIPSSKNVLKKLDYDSLRTVHAEFLPPCFDGDVMFVLPLVSNSALHTKARSIDEMDKHYDGHVWTKALTINISNNLNLTFCLSICIGHLQCQNSEYDYLKRSSRTSALNDTEFDGFSKEFFPVGGPPPSLSNHVCKICKEPPKYVVVCNARMN